MVKQKIYVVSDIDEFKEWCEEKIGDRITAEDYIELEKLNGKDVHIVQHPFDSYSIGTSVIEYDIYAKKSNRWERNDIIKIVDIDIKELLEEDVIEELEEKKDILAFKVIDAKKFYNEILNDIEDLEFICMIYMIGRQRNNPDIYIINDASDYFKILFRDGKINLVRGLPESILNKEKVLALFRENIITGVKCEYIKKSNSIKFGEQQYFLTNGSNNLRGVTIREDKERYIATTYLKKPNSIVIPARGLGKNEREAITNLKNRVASYLGHDTEKIINLYQKQIDKEDYDY